MWKLNQLTHIPQKENVLFSENFFVKETILYMADRSFIQCLLCSYPGGVYHLCHGAAINLMTFLFMYMHKFETETFLKYYPSHVAIATNLAHICHFVIFVTKLNFKGENIDKDIKFDPHFINFSRQF